MKLTRPERQAMNSPRHALHTQRTAEALLQHVSLPEQPYCLEVGCGQGALARLLAERYDAQVIASDYDPAQVTLAQKRLSDLGASVEFRIVDARAIPFNDAEFDAIFSFGVLHHIPGGWREAVAEIARVLKPDGWFVFTDLVVTPFFSRLMRWLLPQLDMLEDKGLHKCLIENGLGLEHYAHGRGEFMAVLGMMSYCTAAARKSSQDTLEEWFDAQERQ
jgi:ubiquinone/menaquinone biosynthesis C-methylase UbiE